MKSETKVLLALGTGIAIGGILGVLFAPRKGADTRRKISEAGSDLAEKMKEKAEKGKEVLAGLKDGVEQVIALKAGCAGPVD